VHVKYYKNWSALVEAIVKWKIVSFLDHSVSIYLFSPLISELTEQNSTKIGHMIGSKCGFKTHVQNPGYPLPYKSGAQKPPFWQFCNLLATLTAYIIRTKRDMDNWTSAFETTRGLLHCLRTTWTLVYKLLKIGPEFSPTFRKLCVFLHCWVLHRDFRPQNSTKLCYTVGVNHSNKLP